MQHGVQRQRGFAEERHAAVIHEEQAVLGRVQQDLQSGEESRPAGASVQNLTGEERVNTYIESACKQGWQGVAKLLFTTGFNRFKPAGGNP